jgi:hypothetical protein
MEEEIVYIIVAFAALVVGVGCCICQKKNNQNLRPENETAQPQLQHQQQFQQQQGQIFSVYNEQPNNLFRHKIVAHENDPPPSYESVVKQHIEP